VKKVSSLNAWRRSCYVRCI